MSHASHAGRRGRVAASPRSRRLMRSLGIDPHSVAGSGPGGRIVEADVRRAQSAAAAAPGRSAVATPAVAAQARGTGALVAGNTSTMRRAIAHFTTLSAAVPQFQLRAEVDVTALTVMRGQLLERIESDAQVRLSYTDLLLKAQALALGQTREACAVWQDGGLVPMDSIDLGVVVSVPGGLLIPVIRQVDRLGLGELAAERSALVAAARAGKLSSDRLGGGLSSLSNLGNGRIDEFSALLAPPQNSILAVGSLAERPLVVDGQLVVRPTLKLTLSADHRVMDGALGAELLARIVELLERPALLLYR
ncbi:MAG TPA: 2-oxo acid dehydrogenase subunit E2 [Pirellulales bacterium]|nr:2-oxo acid dehydrogenase subunit E2 [Pirellulales bacterium]